VIYIRSHAGPMKTLRTAAAWSVWTLLCVAVAHADGSLPPQPYNYLHPPAALAGSNHPPQAEHVRLSADVGRSHGGFGFTGDGQAGITVLELTAGPIKSVCCWRQVSKGSVSRCIPYGDERSYGRQVAENDAWTDGPVGWSTHLSPSPRVIHVHGARLMGPAQDKADRLSESRTTVSRLP
jgi:hypothetical protein